MTQLLSTHRLLPGGESRTAEEALGRDEAINPMPRRGRLS
jgi:hypothetical protein